MDYRIREALPADLAPLVEMARTAFVQAFTAGNKPENIEAYQKEAFTKEKFEKDMECSASTFVVAELDGRIIGYLKTNCVSAQTDLHDPESLEVERLYVLQEFWSMGLGQKFLGTAMDIARRKEKKYLWLGVWEHNTKAIRFYEKSGFRIFGTHPFFLWERDTDRLPDENGPLKKGPE